METMTRRSWLWRVVAAMALYSFAPLEIRGGFDWEGVPYSLVPRRPDLAALDADGRVIRYNGEEVDPGGWHVVRRTVWPSIGASESAVIRLARSLIAEIASVDAYGLDYWQAGGTPMTVLKTDQDLYGKQGEEYRDKYVTSRTLGPSHPLVLSKGFDIAAFGAELSTAEQRQELVAGLARYWGLPPTIVNAPTLSGSMVYQNVAELGTFMVTYTLTPYAEAIADLLSELLPGDYVNGRHVTLDLSHLAKPSPGARASYYETMTRIGAMSIPEVRDAEGLPPIERVPEPAPIQDHEPAEVVP